MDSFRWSRSQIHPKVVDRPRILSYQRTWVSGQVSIVTHIINSWVRSLIFFSPKNMLHSTSQHLLVPSSALDMSQKREISCSIQLYRSTFYKQIHEVSSALVVLLSGSDEQPRAMAIVRQEWWWQSTNSDQPRVMVTVSPTVTAIINLQWWW